MEESATFGNSTQFTADTMNCSDDDIDPVDMEDDHGVLHLMGHEVFENDDLLKKIEECTPYKMISHVLSDTLDVKDLATPQDTQHYFVFEEFENSAAFYKLRKAQNAKIIGVLVIYQCIQRNKGLCTLSKKTYYNIFTLAMHRMKICFTNFSDKKELNELGKMVRVMGGTTHAEYDYNSSNIILVAKSAGRTKYESHCDLGKKPLRAEWVVDCYNLRKHMDLDVLEMLVDKFYECPIFYGLRVALYGFEDQREAMEPILKSGAKIVEVTDKRCTHLVVHSSAPADCLQTLLPGGPGSIEVVNDVWLWECVSMDQYLAPKFYKFPVRSKSSGRTDKKRKQNILSFECNPSKRRSCSSELSDSQVFANTSVVDDLPATPDTPKRKHKPDMIIAEYIATERTYVKHLRCIERNYFDQIYSCIGWDERPVPNHISISDNYRIFSKITPILIAHSALVTELNKFMKCEGVLPKFSLPGLEPGVRVPSFAKILLNWIGRDYNEKTGEDVPLAPGKQIKLFEYPPNMTKTFNKSRREWDMMEDPSRPRPDPDVKADKAQYEADLKQRKARHESDLRAELKAEPPVNGVNVGDVYKNYLTNKESVAKLLDQCEATCLRFKALLKSEEMKKENDRLSIRDLMIEPVQRIPRMILLIGAIINRTEPANPDYPVLLKVQERFKILADELNCKKYEVDSKYELMGLLRDISGLPIDKMSASLRVVDKLSVTSLNDIGTAATGTALCLFVFCLTEDPRAKQDRLKQNEKRRLEGQQPVEFHALYSEHHDAALEIARPRLKTGSVTSAASVGKATKKAQYKHVLHLPLRAVTNVFKDPNEEGFGIEYEELDSKHGSALEENKPLRKKILFRILAEDIDYTDQSARLREWLDALVDSVNASRPHFGRPLIERDGNCPIKPLLETQQLLKENQKSSHRNILNLAKRSLSRAFSQKSEKHALRKTQSQYVLSPRNSEDSGSAPGAPVKFQKRFMRDSH